ncbi:MAG UNVERIFIED_CONTAM: hypothetical protein LVR29_06370 [Microcystis novacekii LVE1205-3]
MKNIREYVAQLQLHMALQARNLVPSLTNTSDSRRNSCRIPKQPSKKSFPVISS